MASNSFSLQLLPSAATCGEVFAERQGTLRATTIAVPQTQQLVRPSTPAVLLLPPHIICLGYRRARAAPPRAESTTTSQGGHFQKTSSPKSTNPRATSAGAWIALVHTG